MSDFDLVIRGGTVVTAADTVRADVGVRGGVIAAVAETIEDGRRTIDASGLLVMPGGIDSHVHLAQPSRESVMADGFESGTRSAIAGGNTTVIPFALQPRGHNLRAVVEDYHRKAEAQAYCDYGFHLIITDPTPTLLGQELPALVHDGYTSFKVFMTYDDMVLDDRQLLDVFDCARGCGALVMVHCEGYDAIKFMVERLERTGKTAPYYHAASRPELVEREAAHRAISHAELLDVPLMIVHVSGRQAMEQIRWAQQRGLKVYGETCPQYVALTADDLKGLNMDETGGKYVCSPPPRDRASWDAIWEGLRGGVFQTFSSDHCPFRYEDPQGKLSAKGRTSFRWVPNGIPGVETRLPILFTKGVVDGPHLAERVRRVDLDQPRQNVRALSPQRVDRARLRRRPRALGPEPQGDDPAGNPASWRGLHALRGARRHRLAGHDDPQRLGRDGGGSYPWRADGRPVPSPLALALRGPRRRPGRVRRSNRQSLAITRADRGRPPGARARRAEARRRWRRRFRDRAAA